MAKTDVNPVPKGFHSVTPYLVVRDAAKAIDFYEKAFGAQEVMRMEAPGGKISHAEIKIGDSIVMIADENPNTTTRSPQALNGTTVGLFVYFDNVDPVFNQAVAAGAKVTLPLADQFWGDRYGQIADPFGHTWSLATHVEDVAQEEMGRRAQEAMAKMAEQQRAHAAR
jgi:PhnB protein